MITKEATKYWKKAIKCDRVIVANYKGSIYIVNGYNAFKFPAMPVLWDEIARPAFMMEIPADGASVEYRNGDVINSCAPDVADIFNRVTKNKTEAFRTPFTIDSKDITLRIFRNKNSDIATVNVAYDALVDFSYAENIYFKSHKSPVYVTNSQGFEAILMPVLPDYNSMKGAVLDSFAKLLEE